MLPGRGLLSIACIDYRDNDLGDGDQSYDDRNRWDLGGANASFGLQAQVHERVRLGLAYETRLTADGDYRLSEFAAGDTAVAESVDEESIRYPASWRFGGAFYPRSDPRTVFNMLFVAGSDAADRSSRRRTNASILDWITDEIA